MRSTAFILVLAISTVSLLGVCLVQRQQIQRLSAQREELARAVERDAQAKHSRSAVAKGTKAASISQAKTKSAEVNAVEPEPAIAPAAAKALPAPANDAPMAGLAKMMKNPGMKDMIRAQQKGQQDMMYGSLFKFLQLPEADMESFKSLLLDRQMALVDSSMDMMSGEATPEEKKAAAENMKETTAAYDAQIKALLGDDNYAVYKSFEDTQAERMQVTLYKGSLAAGDQLTDEQEDSLIRAMHDARSAFKSDVPGFGDKQTADPSQFTPEGIENLLAESAKLQEQYVAKAAAILTPAQLELFKANQKQQQAMQEMGMKMAAKMFGKQPAK
jgi:hypothetical protein